MSSHTYLVSASHPHPDFCFQSTEVVVHETHFAGEPVVYYATHPKLGCGKDRKEPVAAILQLFCDHACTVTEISGGEPDARDEDIHLCPLHPDSPLPEIGPWSVGVDFRGDKPTVVGIDYDPTGPWASSPSACWWDIPSGPAPTHEIGPYGEIRQLPVTYFAYGDRFPETDYRYVHAVASYGSERTWSSRWLVVEAE